jgi:hypothetical protein
MNRFVSLKLWTILILAGAGSWAAAGEPAAGKSRVALKRDDAQGQLQILIDGREALVYEYGKDWETPHYYPVRSPSGKLLTIQKSDPFPHHRSFWFGDSVQLAGHDKPWSFYACLYSQVDKKDPHSPYAYRIRHVKFLAEQTTPGGATIRSQSIWEADLGKTPVLDEDRQLRVAALGGGEYLLDCTFTLTAAYGDVTFKSDAVHYAWPYLRMHPQFAVEIPAKPGPAVAPGGKKLPPPPPTKSNGTITNSEGDVNQKGTVNKPARWCDYSATIDGLSEGLTIFADPQQPPPRFLTRNYGTFGPRRPDDRSGKPFVLKKGDSLRQRVGILVHSGDVRVGKVSERYQQFAAGKL